jgi:hypothetical protein
MMGVSRPDKHTDGRCEVVHQRVDARPPVSLRNPWDPAQLDGLRTPVWSQDSHLVQVRVRRVTITIPVEAPLSVRCLWRQQVGPGVTVLIRKVGVGLRLRGREEVLPAWRIVR